MSILTVQNVNKHFGGLKALNDVNLSVDEGTVHAIIGPNGAGKSTLLNCFVGRLRPDTGTVMFNNETLVAGHHPARDQSGRDQPRFPDAGDLHRTDPAGECLHPRLCQAGRRLHHERLGRGKRRSGRARTSHGHAERCRPGGKRRTTTPGNCRVATNGGWNWRCVWCNSPKLLLLDEPTAGMARADTNNTIDLLKRIASRGITMVVIEHDMHVVFSLADKISVLAQGTVIAEDLPEKIKGNPKVQEAYLGGAHL